MAGKLAVVNRSIFGRPLAAITMKGATVSVGSQIVLCSYMRRTDATVVRVQALDGVYTAFIVLTEFLMNPVRLPSESITHGYDSRVSEFSSIVQTHHF
jgi:hypothetical protein